MRFPLLPHPDSPAPAIRIEAEARHAPDDRLALRYRITGAVDALLLPPPAPPGRADGLWRHSCFEAFVRPAADAGYWELNFAPSAQWAAYRFSDYRQGMAVAGEVPPPRMEMLAGRENLELTASVELGRPLGLLADLPWQVGLSAVIEERNGRLSWWALAHPSGEPDFHHSDCFALELPPPERG